MKRFALIAALILLLAGNAFAAWTTPYTLEVHSKNFVRVKVLCTADGSASGALELRTIMSTGDWPVVNGAFLMSVSVVPGTGSVAPDGAYDLNVYDSAGTQTIDKTTTSEASVHTYATSESVGTSQQNFNGVPFDVGDVGSNGDQVTLYFNFYIP